ncbi:MAG: DNA translocase FtsK 4TM domain-containing protein [Methylococcales bacterium]|nr:DNA translocase FtsK 4TM domain-containing protein [Methylococcales bacterium]
MTGDRPKILQISLSILFFVFAFVSSVILFSYDKNDSAWTSSDGSLEINNILGTMGAWVADITLSLFGFMAFLFPFMLAWHSYLLFQRKQPKGPLNTLLSALGLAITVLAGTAIFYLYIPSLSIELPHGRGGILGEMAGDSMLFLFSDGYAPRLILGIFILGMTIFSGPSWFSIMDWVGKHTCQVAIKLHHAITDRSETDNSDEAFSSLYEEPSLDANKPNDFPLKKSKPNNNTNKSAKISKKPTPVYHAALPDASLLVKHKKKIKGYSKTELETIADLVETVLDEFNISVKVVDKFPGPVITRFELLLAPGIKVSKVSGLTKDIARGLSVQSVRIVDVIPGKPVIGLEIPNKEREIVSFNELVNSKEFSDAKSPLTLILGKDIASKPVMADLGKMPHLLVAGTTGSGKSVAINTMILSLLFKSSPKKIRLIMIDPKMLELSVYEGIPHLLTPVVTDMKEASNALRWAVAEMERRYKLMSKLGVRNLQGFNHQIERAIEQGHPILDPLFQPDPLIEGKQHKPSLEALPHIVIVIDELADMMMIVGKKVEELIARLAQKARAAGIHLILATQRPSVDVLTGLIKANVPTRISFQVSSRIDSRTILDQSGAEGLLGNGDMLYLPPGTSIPIRAHGAFVDDDEVHSVVEFLKTTAPTNYLTTILDESKEPIPGLDKMNITASDSEIDVLYDQAVAFVIESRKASISSVQRRLKVGYNRAARMIDEMEEAGVISGPEHNGSRTVLSPALDE